MQTSYMEYAMSVIISRALPDVRDGLKPVQRRILYAMHRAGATAGTKTKKCAAFVGDVMKLYHPHGDAAIYDALVRMAQPFSLRYPLIEGQGNFGSVDGDPPAAMRYTEARLSAISGELMAELVAERKLEGIADLRDESDRNGMRIVIELKREAQVFSVLNNLYKHTTLQTTFGVIMLAIVEGRPVVLSLKQALQLFIDHRRNVILRRTRFDLERAQERAHILEGLKICLDHLDEVIKTIPAASDQEVASTQLQSRFGLSERQAKAVLALTLGRLTRLERGKIDEEYEQVIKTIAYLESILASDQKVRLLIKEEMDDVVKKYGDDRRTEITGQEAIDLSAEDLVLKEDVVVTLTHRGYAKRQPLRVFRAQKRGGVGLKGAKPTAGSDAPSGTREEDYALHLLTTHTHASMLFFTQSGRVFQLRVHEVPERERQAKGMPINNLIDIGSNERITSVFVRPETESEAHYMLMATKNGYIKKTAMAEYANGRRNGLIAINLQEDDEIG